MPSPPASSRSQDAPMGRGTPTAPRGLGSSRHSVAAAWKGLWPGGKAHLDHCDQPWDGRRRDRPGLVTGREDQGPPLHPRPSQTSRPYLSLRAPHKHPSTSCSWILTAALGARCLQTPTLQSRNPSLRRSRDLEAVAQVRSVAGPWPGGLAGRSTVPYTQRLQVQFQARAHTWVLDPVLAQSTYGQV